MTTRVLLVTRIVAIAAACMLSSSRPALADSKSEAKAHVAAADTAYQLGRFAEALAEYSKAYELYPAPPLLFNIGQCHRGLKSWDQAIFFYQGYLRARPDAENRAFVEGLIQDAQSELDRMRAAEAARTADEAALAKQRADEQDKLRLEAERRRIEEEQQLRLDAERQKLAVERAEADRQRYEREARARDDDKFYRKWWFWSAIGGVALAAGGTAYYFSGSTTIVPPSGSLGGLDRR